MSETPRSRIILIVVALVGAGVIFLITNSGSGPATGKIDGLYFFDLDSAQLYTAAPNAIPPETAPSGGVGARAYVYTCGQCDENDRFTLYIEKYSDKAREAVANRDSGEHQTVATFDRIVAEGRSVAEPPAAGEEPTWIEASSSEARTLTMSWTTRCGGQPAKACNP